MVYHGFLRLGGVDVVNTERARGYATTADCPLWMIQERPCPSINDALFDDPYTFENIALAPWFDQSLPDLSSRFYGVVGLSMSGIDSSTRESRVTEGIGPGGTIGRSRKAVKSTRVRATLLSRGDDAMEYGLGWLNAAFDGVCGQHGDGCGTMDMEFLADCPPERGTVPDFTAWAAAAENRLTNPGFEAPGAAVEVRRNLLRYTDTTSTTGWVPTSGAVAAVSGRIQFTQNTTNPARLGATQTLLATKAAGTYAASFRAQTADASITGVRVYLYDSTAAVIRASQSIPLVAGGAENRYDFSLTASGSFNQVYLEFYGTSIPSGAIGFMSEPILEAGSLLRPFFSGAAQPRTRRNLALNPRGIGAGGTGWQSNIAATNPVTRGVTPPIAHPLGITTAVEQSSTGTSSALVTMYNIDSLLNTGTPQRTHGLWILVTEPGYVAYGITLPANEWTFVRVPTPVAAGAHSGFYVNKATGLCSTTVRAYLTGLVTEAGSAPVGDYFDGEIGAPAGYAGGWVGTAGASASFQYDNDFTVAWTGAAGASESVLNGITPAGVSGVGVAAVRSQHWTKDGSYSLRLIASSVSNNISYVVLTPTGDTTPRGTAIVTRRQIAAITGSTWAAGLGRIYWNPTPQVFSDPAPNAAGEVELRVYAPAGAVVSTIVLPHGGLAGTADVWYDLAAVLPGVSYTGRPFTGATVSADPELERFSWTGVANASTSLRETREAIMRPQTDEEYAAVVNPLRRFMHSVGITSGPIVISSRRSSSGTFSVVTVEWTVTSERPFIYSLTRPVTLPTTETMLVQDVPFNLIPYPSAEVAGPDVVLATNFSTNPSVETNATGWASSQDGTNITAAMLTSGRVTGELAAIGTSSFRVVFTATGAGTNGVFYAQQEVDLTTRPANSRVSFNLWAAEALMAGTPVRPDIEFTAVWRATAGGATLRTDTIGTIAVDGGAVSMKSILPPAGANFVLVRASARLTSWPAGTIVRLYADALAVTVP